MERILYLGNLSPGNTSKDRFQALQKLGYEAVGIDKYRESSLFWQKASFKVNRWIGIYLDFFRLNQKLIRQVNGRPFHILWIDKGIEIAASTLKKIKKSNPELKIVLLNPDDPFGKYSRGWARHKRAIPYYDIHFVSRRENIEEYQALGAKRVHYYDRSFSTEIHRPVVLSAAERKKYSCEVGFIGSYEKERARSIAFLIEQGIPVTIYGNGWENRDYWEALEPFHQKRALIGDEYVKGLNGMKIALHFLRKANRDEQDSRTFEIPACGTFMLAERSPKHEELFEEGKEAVFFDSDEDLLAKVQHYLAADDERQAIALAGKNKSWTAGYDHESRMRQLLDLALKESG